MIPSTYTDLTEDALIDLACAMKDAGPPANVLLMSWAQVKRYRSDVRWGELMKTHYGRRYYRRGRAMRRR